MEEEVVWWQDAVTEGMKSSNKTKAYLEGYRNFFIGEFYPYPSCAEECPYEHDSEEYKEWMIGADSAMIDFDNFIESK